MEIPENADKLYVDVGLSSEAIQSQSWLEKVDTAFVVGFEPSHEARKKIYSESRSDSRWLKRENFHRIHIEECALSIEPKMRQTFYRPNIDVGCSSLLKPQPNCDAIAPHFNGVKEAYQVRVDSLNNFFNNNPLLLERFKRIEYVKIDAQGSDLNIIKGGLELIKENVVWLTAEGDGHYYIENMPEEDRCSTTNIVKIMEELGFIKYDHPNTTDPTFYNPKFEDWKDVYINQY